MELGYNHRTLPVMDTHRSPRFLSVLWLTLFLGLIGWGGLIILIWTTVPYIWARWLFYFLFIMGISGAVLPFVYFLNRRFPGVPPADGYIILRQAIWFGIYGGTLAWLQSGRALTSWAAFFLAVGLMLVETLLRLFERSRWKPKESGDE
jgi:hypothetical protein